MPEQDQVTFNQKLTSQGSKAQTFQGTWDASAGLLLLLLDLSADASSSSKTPCMYIGKASLGNQDPPRCALEVEVVKHLLLSSYSPSSLSPH